MFYLSIGKYLYLHPNYSTMSFDVNKKNTTTALEMIVFYILLEKVCVIRYFDMYYHIYKRLRWTSHHYFNISYIKS